MLTNSRAAGHRKPEAERHAIADRSFKILAGSIAEGVSLYWNEPPKIKPLSKEYAPLSSYFVFLGLPKSPGSRSDIMPTPMELPSAAASQAVARIAAAKSIPLLCA